MATPKPRAMPLIKATAAPAAGRASPGAAAGAKLASGPTWRSVQLPYSREQLTQLELSLLLWLQVRAVHMGIWLMLLPRRHVACNNACVAAHPDYHTSCIPCT